MADTSVPDTSRIAAARAVIRLALEDGETPEPWLYEVTAMPEEAARLAELRHEQLMNLLHDVGHSWGMPADGILQLAETIEDIYGA